MTGVVGGELGFMAPFITAERVRFTLFKML